MSKIFSLLSVAREKKERKQTSEGVESLTQISGVRESSLDETLGTGL